MRTPRHFILRFIDALEKRHTHTQKPIGQEKREKESGTGSILYLETKEYVKSVKDGNCPVEVALSAYKWPVRSAVVASLCVAFESKNVRRVFHSGRYVELLKKFMSVSVKSLQVRSDFVGLRRDIVTIAQRGKYPLSPKQINPRAVEEALLQLTRCLKWLCENKSGCPQAVRPHLARLVASLYTSGFAEL